MHSRFARAFAISLCLLAGISLWAGGPGTGPATVDPSAPTGDGTMPALTAIAGHGMMDSHPVQHLQELSDDVGGRVTGSPQAAKAIEWGLAKMRAVGLSNVHTEKWQLSRGWTRVSADAEMVSPIQRELSVDSMGWVGSTPKGGVEGEVAAVDVGHLDQEVKENSGKWANKILLVIRKEKGEEPKREER